MILTHEEFVIGVSQKDKPKRAKKTLTHEEFTGGQPLQNSGVTPSTLPPVFQSFTKSFSSFNAGMSRAPAALFGLAATPQNLIARYTGWNVGTKAPEWMLDNPISQYFDDSSESLDYKNRTYPGQTLESLMEEKRFGDASDYLFHSILENAVFPITAVSGGLVGIPQAASLTAIGGSVTGGKFKQARDKGLEELEATYAAVISGGTEVLFEGLGTFGVLRWGKELFKNVGEQTGKTILKNVFKFTLGATASGGTEEGLTQIVQDFTDVVFEVDDIPLKDFPSRAFEASLIGAITEGAVVSPGGISIGVQASVEKRRQDKRLNDLKEKFDQFKKDREAKEVAPEVLEEPTAQQADILELLPEVEASLQEGVVQEELLAKLEEAGIDTKAAEELGQTFLKAVEEGADPFAAIQSILTKQGVKLDPALLKEFSTQLEAIREITPEETIQKIEEAQIPLEEAAKLTDEERLQRIGQKEADKINAEISSQELQEGREVERPAQKFQAEQTPAGQLTKLAAPRTIGSLDDSIKGFARDFKSLFGNAPLTGTAELLRGELVRLKLSKKKAITARVKELETRRKQFILKSKEAESAPEKTRSFFAISILREIERYLLLGKKVPKGYAELHDKVSPGELVGHQITALPKESLKAKPKTRIREITGQIKTEDKLVSSFQALKESLKAQEKAASKTEKLTLAQVKRIQSDIITALEGSKLEGNDKAKFIRTIKNIQTEDQLKSAIPGIQERVDSLIEASAKRKTLEAIRKELRTIKPRKQSGRLVGKFTPLIQDILTKMRAAERMTQAQAIEKLEANLSANASGNLVIPDVVIAMENKMLSAVANRGDLTASELADLFKIVRALKVGGSQLATLREFKELADLEEKRTVAKSIIDSRPKDAIPTTANESADDTKFGWYNRATAWLMGWDNIMNRLSWADKSTKTNKSALNKLADVSEVETSEKKGRRIFLRRVRKMWTDIFGDVSDWRLTRIWAIEAERKSLGKFKNNRGETIEILISKAEARKRWMEFQDPTLQDTLFGLEENSMGWTQEIANAITNSLSAQDIAFAKAQLDFYQKYYSGFNAVFSEINGVNLPKNTNYSPIRRTVNERQALESELLGEITTRRSITPSAGKLRVKNLRNLEQLNDVEIIQKHINQAEHYKAWAKKIRVLNGVFNSSGVRESIQANFGKGILRVVDSFIEDFTRGGIDRSNDSAVLNIIKNNYTVAVLSGKFSITIKQLMSFPAFADAIPTKDFIVGMSDLGTGTLKKLKILAASEVMRSRGLSITPEMAEAVGSREWAAFQLNPTVRNMLLVLTRFGDRGAIYVGGWSVYRYHKDVLGEPHSKAIKAFEDSLSSAQQSADLSQTTIFQRGNSWQRLFSVFLSAPNQYFRKELSSTDDMIAGRITKQEWSKQMAIYHFILPMLFQWAADGLEWRVKEQVRAGLLGSLNGVFILGQILHNISSQALGLKTWQSSTIIDSVAREAMKFFKSLKPEDLDAEAFFEIIKSGGRLAGVVKGLPAQQAINLVEGVNQMATANNSKDFRNGMKRIAGWSGFVVDQGQKPKRKF